MPKVNEESEMEEGEIVDELDDLSDISSEEEFLLRQRLEVLETYNNVLERKKTKCTSIYSEIKESKSYGQKSVIIQPHAKTYSKQKRKKELQYVDENNVKRKRESHKKKTSRSRKKLGVRVLSETSESEDEYRSKRRKLAEAVIVHRSVDKSSLSARLHNMINWSETHLISEFEHKKTETAVSNNQINLPNNPLSLVSSENDDPILVDVNNSVQKEHNNNFASIVVSSDDDVEVLTNVEDRSKDENQSHEENIKMCQDQADKDSDEDLELLRQHALKSKSIKPQVPDLNKTELKPLSEDEDSDTAELRLICLKSALLKKAIEMKRKQKMQKKLSQSSNLEDDLLNDENLFSNKGEDNNTDIESVDMDMGSDAEEKAKNGSNYENEKKTNKMLPNSNSDVISCVMNINSTFKGDELDDDEDLLRAQLLTSLSKNLTNLVNPEVLNTIDEVKKVDNLPQNPSKPANVPEAKKFIIQLNESDSEEHEATKNLKKMHMKLSEQVDFQQKLDLFLKSTRMEVEKSKLPGIVQQEVSPKTPPKFVAKAVNNLPKSEQLEYKNLVKRMAELEKMKQIRQESLNLLNQQIGKDTLKPRNVTIDSKAAIDNLETQIAKSRKVIADESAKMLKLKEEATKLSRRYKIASTELRNITTAITLNKKQQRAVQLSLNKIRQQHQSLLMSSTSSLHSKVNGHIPNLSHLSNKAISLKMQKENNPKKEYKDPVVQKTVKISFVNDFVKEDAMNNPKLSVQLDVTNNKKIVVVPKTTETGRGKEDLLETSKDLTAEVKKMELNKRLSENDSIILKETEKESNEATTTSNELIADCGHENRHNHISVDDYKSPLDAFGSNTWQADLNAILCPFEIGGQCKDPDCKYLHTPTPQ